MEKYQFPSEALANSVLQQKETQAAFLKLVQEAFGKAISLPANVPFSKDTMPWLMYEIVEGRKALDQEGEIRKRGFFIPCRTSSEHEIRIGLASNGIRLTVYLSGGVEEIERDGDDNPIDIVLPWA